MHHRLVQSLIFLSFLGVISGCASKRTSDEPVKSTYFHQYGPEIASKDWYERGANGQVVHVLQSGATSKETYRDGKFHGLCTFTFPHSDIIQVERFYDNGQMLWQRTHAISGVPQEEQYYEHTGKLLITRWYEDGTPSSREEFEEGVLVSGQYFNLNHELDSEVKTYNGTKFVRDVFGALLAKEEIVSGEVASKEEFYPNGMPFAYTDYLEGKIHGIRKTFNPGGDPKTIEEWTDGMLHGTSILFENGEEVAAVPYVQGFKCGKEQRFHKGTDIVVEEISWRNDKRHGPSIVYLEGKKYTSWYFQGKKVSKVEFTQLDHGGPSDMAG